jgi:hypothetical protein
MNDCFAIGSRACAALTSHSVARCRYSSALLGIARIPCRPTLSYLMIRYPFEASCLRRQWPVVGRVRAVRTHSGRGCRKSTALRYPQVRGDFRAGGNIADGGDVLGRKPERAPGSLVRDATGGPGRIHSRPDADATVLTTRQAAFGSAWRPLSARAHTRLGKLP